MRGNDCAFGQGSRLHWLVAGYALSTAGNYLNLVALGLYTFQVTGDGLGVALVMALRLGAGSAGGIAGGFLVARTDRRRLMIGADVAQALAMTALVLGPRDVGLLAVVVVVLGAGNSVFSVALRTSVPDVVGHEQRVRANGLLVTAKSLGTVAGFASAGVVIGTGGLTAAFALNATSFVASALTVLMIRVRVGTPVASTGRRRVPNALALVPALLLGMVAVRGADALASASHNVALPVLASTGHVADGAAFLSRFWVMWAVGTLLAHQVLTRWRRSGGARREERLFAVATGVMALSFPLAFTGLPAPALMCAALVAGLADGVAEITCTSRLQELPEPRRGAVFGLAATAETAGFATGMVAAGAVLEVLPAAATVALFHGVALCAAAVFLVSSYVGGTDHDEHLDAGVPHRSGAGADR
ncbi:MFS transporter [Lentzea sp. NPDC003310]|uniref:MFS transporter n=1 Tax=Lentzea sp. NPDC003310 TaxID=3154447 RepID=UPI0033B6103D